MTSRACARRALATDDAFRDVLIAVDTFHAEVARSAIAAGAHMVNDVSGGEFDENMHAEVRALLSDALLCCCTEAAPVTSGAVTCSEHCRPWAATLFSLLLMNRASWWQPCLPPESTCLQLC
jgi:Pterin binding enzyme